ncbi:hypothetical protein HSBAA_PA_2490 (plasmid) [Vreelandella sulfidaeris]|uniref:CopC domain-containing protein n=1 Tax=Vreelandella sulfidaeris TaxID=115553 RepID=A0A455UHB2_9GAMM|nr:hypothetical protein HSBAA_PA_2490 [Halomonas sulfidaeris]
MTIQDSPAEIGIEFGGMMRITQFEVTGPDGSVPLDGQPGSEQVERYFVKPGEILSAGDYQVCWRGLSDDGHMMTDGFNFSVEPRPMAWWFSVNSLDVWTVAMILVAAGVYLSALVATGAVLFRLAFPQLLNMTGGTSPAWVSLLSGPGLS